MMWNVWWVWIVAGFSLGVLEILAPGYIFLGFAIGALVTGGLFFELPLPVAVIGHEGGTLLVVLNGLRLLNDPIRRGRNPA